MEPFIFSHSDTQESAAEVNKRRNEAKVITRRQFIEFVGEGPVETLEAELGRGCDEYFQANNIVFVEVGAIDYIFERRVTK